MVRPATAPNQLLYWKTPAKSKNSPTNPFVKGNATLPNKIIINRVESWGAFWVIPPSSLKKRLWVLDWMISMIKNRPTTLMPCDKDCIIRSEEHTSELQSRENLVCRLLP